MVGDRWVADPSPAHCTDWTGRFVGAGSFVVSPGSTAEVAAVVRCCSKAGVAVVPQGGNTGLVGGGIPYDDAVVISLRRLNSLGPVSGGQLTAGAGVTIAALHAHVGAAGFSYGVDFAARDSATVGGTIATDAGGVRVCAYGSTRSQVVGLEAVLADGSVVSRLDGLAKSSGGYDLAQLLVASEGTLGIVTAARLRVVETLPSERVTALVPVVSIGDAVALLRPGLLAAEYIERSVMALTGGPTDAFAYVLLEAIDGSFPDDALVAVDARSRAELWRFREDATVQVSTQGVPIKLDVALPLDRIAEFRAALDLAGLYIWGHLAEGNLHVNVIGADPTEQVLRLVASFGGSISSEHGIGRAKREWLSLSRSPAEIAAMTAVKDALDPTGLLNPGVLLPAR